MLRGSVPVRESLFSDIEANAKLAREAGVLQLAKLTREASRDQAQRGGLLIRDHRKPSAGATVDLPVAYRFRPRLRTWGPGCELDLAKGSGRGAGVSGSPRELADLLRQVAFEPVTYSWDPHFMSVVYLQHWAGLAGAIAPMLAPPQHAAG